MSDVGRQGQVITIASSGAPAEGQIAGGQGPATPGRLRSAGVLTEEELAHCRAQSIAVSYDPVQIGWVPSHVIDDVAGDDEDLAFDAQALQASSSTARGPRPDAARARVEQQFARWVQREAPSSSAPADLAAAIWAKAESLVAEAAGELAPADQLDLLRTLQAQANALIHQHAESREETARRLETSLAHGASFVLRPWSEQDLDRYIELLDNAEVWKFLPEAYPAPLTRENATDLINISNSLAQHEVFAIERDGEVVGQVRMLFGTDGASDCEISYWLGHAYWGQGIISKIIPLYTAQTFQRMSEIRSIFAKVAVGNDGSARALRKAGYRDEGPLASRLAGDEQTLILRCFRADYL